MSFSVAVHSEAHCLYLQINDNEDMYETYLYPHEAKELIKKLSVVLKEFDVPDTE